VTAEQLGFKFTNVPHLMRVRCHFCSRQKREWEVHRLGTAALTTQVICNDCLEWHHAALEFLAGNGTPRGCQSCGATWEFLRESRIGVEKVSMFCVPRDGILVLLCDSCIGPYTAKRADLYRGTAFGATALKL
jgi:hypothetical protein